MIVRRWPGLAAVGAGVLLYVVGTAWVAQRTTLRLEAARAGLEGRNVADALRAGRSIPSTLRPLMAAGPLQRIRPSLERFLGRAGADRVGVDDRALVVSAGRSWYVVQPVKDVDDWEIVGAAVVQVDAWAGLGTVLVIAGVAGLLALLQGLIGVGRLSEADYQGGHIALAGAGAAMAFGTLALVVRVRLDLGAAAASLPPARVGGRFDAMALPLPDANMVAAGLALVTLVALGCLLAAGWVASARRAVLPTRDTITAWSFLAPSALHLAVFTLVPLCFTLYVSLHDWDLLAASRPFVGLANYREMGADPLFWQALRNTILYSLYVPVTLALALGIALALNQPLRGIRILRAMVFLPTVVSFAAIAIVWQWMFNADYGLLNHLLRFVGAPPVDWLADPRTALVAIMLVSAWVQVGYQMVIYLAGLQGIPQTYYEAAVLDGASRWQRFRNITLPLLRPVTVYLFITGVIWSFQVFTLVYVMTEGGPVHATDVLVYRIYQNAWEFRRMGYASAMSWFLFALLFALTLAQWKVINRRIEHAT